MRLTRVRARAPGGDAHAVRTATEHCRTPRRRRAGASHWGTPGAPQFREEPDLSSFAFLREPGSRSRTTQLCYRPEQGFSRLEIGAAPEPPHHRFD